MIVALKYQGIHSVPFQETNEYNSDKVLGQMVCRCEALVRSELLRAEALASIKQRH